MPRKKSSGPRKAKKPKEFNFDSWFISALRRASRKYPPHYAAENAVKEEYFVYTKKGKPLKRVQFPCAICKKKFKRDDIVRDHITPVVDPTVGFPLLPDGKKDWNTYIGRMFVPTTAIQIICKGCHKVKCDEETAQRVEQRKQQRDN